MAQPVSLVGAARVAEALRDTARRLKRMEKHCRLDAKELMQDFAYLQLLLASLGIDTGGHSHGEEEDEKGTTPESRGVGR
jgi:hypothetical protein